MTTTPIIDIIAMCGFFGIILMTMLGLIIWLVIHTIVENKCNHDWEDFEVHSYKRASIITVLKCRKCGKIKKIR